MLARPRRLLSLGVAVGLVVLLTYALVTVPGDSGWINSWKTMDTAQYLKDSMHDKIFGAPPVPPWDGKVGDKIIVMAHMPDEDVSWVETELPSWQRAIYAVPTNTSSASDPPVGLPLPANKGHEAMAYLTYLIDAYDSLPAYVLFLHAHNGGYTESWHVDARLHSNAESARALRLAAVDARGFVPMRCNPRPNCLRRAGDRHPPQLPRPVWEAFWGNTSTPPPQIDEAIAARPTIDRADLSTAVAAEDQAAVPIPPLAAPGGAQFAVSRDRIRERPRADYVALREWLFATDMEDADSGRVFEYQWHVLFGMPGVMCYERSECECEVFGQCAGS